MNSKKQNISFSLSKTLWAVGSLALMACAHAESATPLPPVAAAPQQAERTWQPLSQLTYRSVDGAHQLVLYRKDLANFFVTDFKSADKYFRKHPNEGGIPNAAYMLLDTSASASKVRWVEYISQDYLVMPPEHWYANIVWPVGEAAPVVVLTKSISDHLQARVYRVSLKRDISNAPSDPDLAHFDEWPVPDKPISKLNLYSIVTRLADGADGISALTATAVGDGIQLRGEREDKHSPPVYISFNLNTGVWQKGLRPDAMHALGKMDKQE